MSRFTETHDEKIMDQAVALMGVAIPEDKAKAMKKYVDILILLHKLRDPRKEELIEQMRDVYCLPDRSWHNNALTALSHFRETLYREKMEKKKPTGLGLGSWLGDDTQIIYNPPAYYQSSDPNQIPMQVGPTWPGYYQGQRTFTQEEADRMAREKQEFMEQRASDTEVPEYRYISPDGPKLAPTERALVNKLQKQEAVEKQIEVVAETVKKKLLPMAAIGILLKLVF